MKRGGSDSRSGFERLYARQLEKLKRIANGEAERKNRNEAVLADFVRYCHAHPELRFWQALSGWCKSAVFVLRSGSPSELVDAVRRHEFDRGRDGSAFDLRDTFFWEGRDA